MNTPGNRYCFQITAQPTPPIRGPSGPSTDPGSPHRGGGMKLDQVEFQISGMCWGFVQSITIGGIEVAGTYAPAGARGTEAVLQLGNLLQHMPSGKAARAQLCFSLMAQCAQLHTFCPGGACQYAVMDTVSQCCTQGGYKELW